jgi:chromosome segregation ATPase
MANQHRSLISSAAICTTLMFGCTTTNDPSSDNFFAGLANLSRGEYERRVDDKRQTLEAAEEEQERLRAERATADAERDAIGTERQAAEQRLSDIDASLMEMNKRLNEAQGSQQLEEAELVQLERELDALEKQQSLLSANPGLSADAKVRQIDELEEKKKILEEALTSALGQ